MIQRIEIQSYDYTSTALEKIVKGLNEIIDVINLQEEKQLNCDHVFIDMNGSLCSKCGISPYKISMKDPRNKTCFNCFYYLNSCGHVKDPGPCIMWAGLAPR